tara:strand:+ start:539 stop:934 length:396 start_codon:yes stop_codon:yes gene_type:complete
VKLYNIYESLILENTTQALIDAINGKYAVNIWYRDAKTNTLEQRYVFIYALGTSKAGNDIVRAFQAFGGSKSGNSKWKTFLVNNITKIQPTDFKFYKSVDQVKGGDGIPQYKQGSDGSMLGGPKNYVTFDK